jgi:hypothetical protein
MQFQSILGEQVSLSWSVSLHFPDSKILDEPFLCHYRTPQGTAIPLECFSDII